MDNLKDYELGPDPLMSFQIWYKQAVLIEQNADAMAVSTIDQKNNRPDTRFILFKGIVDSNLVFYTNYKSQKAQELSSNPEVGLTFYWHESKKQVRIHGKATRMNAQDSQKYFQSRDRDSQLASYISTQSSPIEDKASLVKLFTEAQKKFEGRDIPCPENWGGYLVTPYEYEFFLYGANRLNDRFLFQNKNNIWQVSRLQP